MKIATSIIFGLAACAVSTMGLANVIDFTNARSISSHVTQLQCERLFHQLVTPVCDKSKSCAYSSNNPIWSLEVTPYYTAMFDIRTKLQKGSGWLNSGKAKVSLDDGKTYQTVDATMAAVGSLNKNPAVYGVIQVGDFCVVDIKVTSGLPLK